MNRIAHSVLKEIGFTLLAEGKTLKVKAEGFSMYPSIKPGSLIYIEPVPSGTELLPGEIIAWKKESGFVVHRLIKVLKDEDVLLITRGDSCMTEDDPVNFEQLAGRVVKVEDPEGKPLSPDSFSGKKPNYSLNRFLVRINLYFGRVKSILKD